MSGIIGLASLFNSCVDAFAYFKAAQRADKDIETLLLKLDIEKARLLVWGNESGIFSANQQHHDLHDETTVMLMGRVLAQIERLLTDAEKLPPYGLRVLETPTGEAIDYVSSKSLAIFRASLSRFWAWNSSSLATTVRRSVIARTKWAIYDRETFQGLVNELKDFVDKVYELVPIDRATQDMIIVADIEAILDISHLAIVESATEDSYPVYFQAASSVKASTEAGTVDRRTLEEHLRDTESTEPNQTTQAPARDTTRSSNSDALLKELKDCTKHFVLTSECRKRHSPSPCDTQQLGPQAASYSEDDPTTCWDVSSQNEQGGNSLWQLIQKLFQMNSIVATLTEESSLIGTLLKENEYALSDAQTGILRAALPLLTVVIYCSPCVCHIHTALGIGRKVSSPFVGISIRPDDRLISSCCINAERSHGLGSILEWVREWEAKASTGGTSVLARFLDRVWVEQRLDHFQYEQPYLFVEERSSRVIIIGEADYLIPVLQEAPGRRVPRAMDIWSFQRQYQGEYVRALAFRFIESQWDAS